MTHISVPDRARLFEAAEASLLGELGNVSIVKFLGGSDEDDARNRWFDAIEAFLAPIPAGVFLRSDVLEGRPVLAFIGGVTLTLDLYELQDRRSIDDAWRVKVMPGLSPVVVDAAAEAVWGPLWMNALLAVAGEETYPVTLRDDAVAGRWAGSLSAEIAESAKVDTNSAHGWVVRAAPSEAPWPWFTNEQRARRAARALAIGPLRIRALFERQVGRR